MKNQWHSLLLFCFIIVGFSSCKVYKQDILFRTDEQTELMEFQAQNLNQNYKIKVNDVLEFRVTPNKGESLTDPYGQFRQQIQVSGGGANTRNQQNITQKDFDPKYYVNSTGMVKLPMVGLVQVEGLTVYQVDSFLNEEYLKYYVEPFVQTVVQNRRVIVLGAVGGQVVELEYENMTLIEVLALVGGINDQGRARNIRLIRGDLKKPQVQVIDLSTIEGMMAANLVVMPNDIVYVERVYRLVPQTIRDFSPILGLTTSILTLILLLSR